jgi:hypothetical protein
VFFATFCCAVLYLCLPRVLSAADFILRVVCFVSDGCIVSPSFKCALQLLEQRLKQGRAPEEVQPAYQPAYVPSPSALNMLWLQLTPAAATHSLAQRRWLYC